MLTNTAPACRVKQYHKVPPIPHPGSILCECGSNYPNHHIPEKGTTRLGGSGCGGASISLPMSRIRRSSVTQFLTNLIISLMKSIDIRSEAAVKLLGEFLDMDSANIPDGKPVNAEHFAHGERVRSIFDIIQRLTSNIRSLLLRPITVQGSLRVRYDRPGRSSSSFIFP